ncbi:MAG: hypothetical protein KAI24_14850, partial [Planctomycetes bacterium]|nr:hypothetical protein [Planctomycetota bacterium]
GISMRHRGGSGLVRIPLGNRAGIAFRLPDGDYEFRTNQPFLERHIDGVSCTVDGDDQIELEIPMAVRSCRIEWLHPDSDRLADDGVVTFSWRDQQHRVVMSHGLSAFRWTLPVGTVQVALVSESGSFAGQLSVVAGNGEQVTQLRMNR